MLKTTICFVAAGVAIPFVLMAQTPFPSEPRPDYGTATVVSGSDLDARLAKAMEARPNFSVTGLSTTSDYIFLVAHRGEPAGAISHPDGHEFHYILEGSGTLVTGGKIVRGADDTATIEGGQTRHVQQGDFILIPKDTPHWYSEVDSLTYLEGRFKAPPD